MPRARRITDNLRSRKTIVSRTEFCPLLVSMKHSRLLTCRVMVQVHRGGPFYTRLADRLCTGPTHQPERFDSSVAYQFLIFWRCVYTADLESALVGHPEYALFVQRTGQNATNVQTGVQFPHGAPFLRLYRPTDQGTSLRNWLSRFESV